MPLLLCSAVVLSVAAIATAHSVSVQFPAAGGAPVVTLFSNGIVNTADTYFSPFEQAVPVDLGTAVPTSGISFLPNLSRPDTFLVAPSLWRIGVFSPFYRYAFPSSVASDLFICSEAIMLADFNMSCSRASGLALVPPNNTISVRFQPTKLSTDGVTTVVTKSFDVFGAVNMTMVWTVAVAEATAAGKRSIMWTKIVSDNDDRAATTRGYVGALFFLVAVVLFTQPIMCGILTGTVWNPFRCLSDRMTVSSDGEDNRIKVGTNVWVISLVVVWAIIVGAGGVPGGMVMLFVFALWAVGIGFAMCTCCFLRRKKCDNKSGGNSPNKIAPAPPAQRSNSEALSTQRDDDDEMAPKGGKPAVSPLSSPRPTCKKWTMLPYRISRPQCMWLCAILSVLLVFICILIIVFFIWTVNDWQLVDRHTGEVVHELVPTNTARLLQLMYAFPSFATNARLAIYAKILTNDCGTRFTKHLSAGEKKKAIYENFIELYSINMTIYQRPSYTQYDSINDWFTRAIRMDMRPAAPQPVAQCSPSFVLERNIVSVADSRFLAFATLADVKVWVKGGWYTRNELLDPPSNKQQYIDIFGNGGMAIFRLAPQDYHRFHSPVSGTVVDLWDLDGDIWSVGNDAAMSKNYIFYNSRRVMVIEPDNRPGDYIGFIAIGATCVGSIAWTCDGAAAGCSKGSRVVAGGEVGYMQFGGSTVILLFKEGSVHLDNDLLTASLKPVESLVRVGEHVGVLGSTIQI